MSIDRELVESCWRCLRGEIPSEAEIGMVCEILGSKQEFLAWLITRKALFLERPDLAQSFNDAALRSHLEPASRRLQSGYPLEWETARKSLNAAIGQVLSAQNQLSANHDALHESILSIASTNGANKLPDRWVLGIRKSK